MKKTRYFILALLVCAVVMGICGNAVAQNEITNADGYQPKMEITADAPLYEIAGCSEEEFEAYQSEGTLLDQPYIFARMQYVFRQWEQNGKSEPVLLNTEEALQEINRLCEEAKRTEPEIPEGASEEAIRELTLVFNDRKAGNRLALQLEIDTFGKTPQEKRDAFYRAIGYEDEADYWRQEEATLPSAEEVEKAELEERQRQLEITKEVTGNPNWTLEDIGGM